MVSLEIQVTFHIDYNLKLHQIYINGIMQIKFIFKLAPLAAIKQGWLAMMLSVWLRHQPEQDLHQWVLTST